MVVSYILTSPPLVDNTPLLMLNPLPTFTPPRVDAEAVGRVYLVSVQGTFTTACSLLLT